MPAVNRSLELLGPLEQPLVADGVEHRQRGRARRSGCRRTSSRARPAVEQVGRLAEGEHAPIGSPPPSALASVMTSGCTPSAWCANQEPVRPMPVCTSSSGEQRAGVRGGRARPPPGSRAARARTPPSPSIGSSSTIAVCVGDRRRRARRRRRTARSCTPPGSGAKAVGLGRLPGERQRAHRPAVEGALGGDHLGPAGEPADLERRLVGLGAGVAEEDPPGPAGELEQPLGQRDGRARASPGWRRARACAPAR